MDLVYYNYFFSGRRRHTRYWRDWSSDVCSSDLKVVDLSYPFGPDTIYWPTARPFQLRRVGYGRAPGGYWYGANDIKIRRASWRERGEVSVVAVSLKTKTKPYNIPNLVSLSQTDS